ncbi:hypothetical protein CC78DRAFT_572585 [Lojkania enalia]|uniref:Trichothecene 3-O-acetyltransferase n=1 Tax=Lojkania enalia TaxID=147567 RepID=A0A9P4JXJ4_9PLEO|nr:hypothetical protein CC78DRAFT_572585 [Didymosphaeria enalia]
MPCCIVKCPIGNAVNSNGKPADKERGRIMAAMTSHWGRGAATKAYGLDGMGPGKAEEKYCACRKAGIPCSAKKAYPGKRIGFGHILAITTYIHRDWSLSLPLYQLRDTFWPFLHLPRPDTGRATSYEQLHMAERSFHLSVLDQRVARTYVQTLSVFPFPSSSEAETAVQALAEGLRVTLNRFPFLAGTLGPEDPVTGKLQLRYPAVVTNAHVADLFTWEIVPNENYNYAHLKRQGMPASVFLGQIFAPRTLREHPGISAPDVEGIISYKDNSTPVIGIGAFFIPGGLVLSTYTHHSVMDGSGRSNFLKHFAEDVRNRAHPLPFKQERDDSVPRLRLDELIAELAHIETDAKARIYGDKVFQYAKTLPEGTPCAGKIFVISAARVQAFRNSLKEQSVETKRPISIFTILSALVWIHVTRARHPHLKEYEDTHIAIAVNLRKRLTAKLSREYMGNLALGTKATMLIADLVSENSVTDKTIIRAIQSIDRSIAKVDEAWIHDHFAYLASLGPIVDTELAMRFRFGPDMYMTSWTNFEAYEDWNIPGTATPAPEFFRRSHSEIDGGIVFLPRKPNANVDGTEPPYEILIRIAEVDMKRLIDEEGGLATWAERIL